MLRVKLISKTLLFGMLCGAFLGCTESDSTTTRNEPLTDRTVTVTSNKPVIPDLSASTTSSADDRRDADVTNSRTNTGVNVRDRNDATKTPLDQHENPADIKITADIRSRVVDTEMSIKAQNVKIITQAGKVTLRGPVQTPDEKMQVEKIARDVAGKDNVDNQLEIASN